MSTVLKRRIRQLEKMVEQVAVPVQPRAVVVLEAPEDAAPAAEKAKFAADQDAAIRRGAWVIVIVGRGSKSAQLHPSAITADSEVDAMGKTLALLPSSDGLHRTALQQVLGSLSGNVIGAVAQEGARRWP